VKTEKGQHPAQPNAEKELVYIIEDDSDFGSFPKPTTRIGVDGNWVGATHGNPKFSFFVDPGIHHLLCQLAIGCAFDEGAQDCCGSFSQQTPEANITFRLRILIGVIKDRRA